MSISELDKQLIKALKDHSETGYNDSDENQTLINAITLGKIRVIREEYDHVHLSDICGDLFEPNQDIPIEQLTRDRKEFVSRVNSSGVWLYVAEYWNGREWLHGDCIGGFIGYDFFGSGYESDLMKSALTEYNDQTLDEDGFVVDPFRLDAALALLI